MNKIVLLDSNSLLNRAFYAIPMSFTDEQGRPTNAVYGFVSMLMKIINDLGPTHIAAAFDVHAPTFRKEKCDYYKATRKPMPEELRTQLGIIKELLGYMGIPIYEIAGYEADDVLGTLSVSLEGKKIIVTGDRDSLQLVSKDTSVWLTKKGISEVIEYDEDRLGEDGLTPNGVIELKSLMGDASDNIKGVAGVGEKTAFDLIGKYGDVATIMQHLDELKPGLVAKLTSSQDIIEESKWLATINKQVPIKFNVDDMLLKYPFDIKAKEYMESLSFKSLVGRIQFKGDNQEPQKEINIIKINDIDAIEEILSPCAVLQCKDGIHLANREDTEYIISIKENLFDDGVDYTDAITTIVEKKDLIFFDKNAFLRSVNVSYAGGNDVHLACYLLDARKSFDTIVELADEFGKSSDYPACAVYSVWNKISSHFCDEQLEKLYYQVELPLVDVLLDMERCGFAIDKNTLNNLNDEYTTEIDEISKKIYNMAGESFNINSPVQLSKILFEKLALPSGKKTKKGFSSSADVLEGIQDLHPIVPLILKYRQLSKLKSTYLDSMLTKIDSYGKVHTIFKQTQTVTGRLSSTEPNLQNIPVRDDEGTRVRRMFVPSRGNKLVCADYSQIELRLLAHFSEDESLIEAYNNGEDIHSATASAVYGVPIDEVTAQMRRSAKAVNFGIIYGISEYGLSVNIGITPKEAKQFIKRYFDRYPAVRKYMDSNVDFAKKNGYATTLLGRKRPIPELLSSNYNMRSFGERAAMNMPLQGTAADIIKMAMNDVYNELKNRGLKAKLILQVHDELIIDTPTNEVEIVKEILEEKMQNAVKLRVPLIAKATVGDNWYEAK